MLISGLTNLNQPSWQFGYGPRMAFVAPAMSLDTLRQPAFDQRPSSHGISIETDLLAVPVETAVVSHDWLEVESEIVPSSLTLTTRFVDESVVTFVVISVSCNNILIVANQATPN